MRNFFYLLFLFNFMAIDLIYACEGICYRVEYSYFTIRGKAFPSLEDARRSVIQECLNSYSEFAKVMNEPICQPQGSSYQLCEVRCREGIAESRFLKGSNKNDLKNQCDALTQLPEQEGILGNTFVGCE